MLLTMLTDRETKNQENEGKIAEMEHFKKGTEFYTYRELLTAKHLYEQESKTLLTTKKSRKFNTDDPRYEELIYSRIQYQCKAGEERKSTSKGSRVVTTSKMNCPVVVTLSVKEGKLCVLNSILQHENHTQDYETFMKYPENLRLKPNEIIFAKELLTRGYNKKTIRSKLSERRGGPLPLKFWAQINKEMKKEASNDEQFKIHARNDFNQEQAFDNSYDQSQLLMDDMKSSLSNVKVKQEFHTAVNTSDDDTNNGDDDPLSNMFEKCFSDDGYVNPSDDSKSKIKNDFDVWFTNLIPGEKLSYNEWLWQLEFNFPSLDKLNFIKYGIILGMTILNRYYYDGLLRIDANGIKEDNAQLHGKRSRCSSEAVRSNDDDDDDDDDDEDEMDYEQHTSQIVHRTNVQMDDDSQRMVNPTINAPEVIIESTGHTTTPILKEDISTDNIECTQSNSQPNETINCKMCTETFPTHSQLYNHMCKMHTGHIGLNCPICNKRFQYERNLNQHIESLHVNQGNVSYSPQDGRAICEICGAAFEKVSSLKSHSRYVHSIEKFYCQYCNRKLSSKKSLKEHIQFQHELTFVTHSCEDCHRIFKYKSSYRLHMRKQHGIHFA